MAKKKTKKKVKRKKGPPKTIKVWIPIQVGVTRTGKVVTYCPEADESHQKPTERTKRQVEDSLADFPYEPYRAGHVVWIEATVPVPQQTTGPTVRGKVIK